MFRQSLVRNLRTIKFVLFVIYALNFLAFLGAVTYLGGDAVNGKVAGGHYYLWGKDGHGHGVYTEVSERIFNYNKWHAFSVLATLLVCLTAAAVESIAKKRFSTG